MYLYLYEYLYIPPMTETILEASLSFFLPHCMYTYVHIYHAVALVSKID